MSTVQYTDSTSGCTPSNCIREHSRSTPLQHRTVSHRVEMQAVRLVPRDPLGMVHHPSDRVQQNRVAGRGGDGPLDDAKVAVVERVAFGVQFFAAVPFRRDDEGGRAGEDGRVGQVAEERVGQVLRCVGPVGERFHESSVGVGVNATVGVEGDEAHEVPFDDGDWEVVVGFRQGAGRVEGVDELFGVYVV